MANDVEDLVNDIKEQVLYLKELGVTEIDVSWETPTIKAGAVKAEQPASVERFVPEDFGSIRKTTTSGSQIGGKTRLANLPTIARIKTETPETKTTPNVDETMKRSEKIKPAEVLFDVSPALAETTDTIESIRAEIGDCKRCALCNLGRKQIVHTTGNFNAELMFVGEAPGADEDEQGFPFVGRAGQLLTKIIESIGMKREEVCIGNINRCRPPGNRKPEPAETAACRPFILREIAVVKPKVVVVLGATAAENLLQVKTPISKLRGHFHDYFGVKVMPTFHPAYLLRDPHKKREVWEDMKKVRDHLNSL